MEIQHLSEAACQNLILFRFSACWTVWTLWCKGWNRCVIFYNTITGQRKTTRETKWEKDFLYCGIYKAMVLCANVWARPPARIKVNERRFAKSLTLYMLNDRVWDLRGKQNFWSHAFDWYSGPIRVLRLAPLVVCERINIICPVDCVWAAVT